MPVLLGDFRTTDLRTTEFQVEKLVEEVRERLCLKSREKLNTVRRSPYSPIMPSGKLRRNGASCVLCSKCRALHRTYSSEKYCCCMDSACKCMSKSETENPNHLLKKLLAEQRLIQEAVRRIQTFHHQYGDSTANDCLDPDCLETSSYSSERDCSSLDSVNSSAFSSTSDL